VIRMPLAPAEIRFSNFLSSQHSAVLSASD
jgi:hypothetical protein